MWKVRLGSVAYLYPDALCIGLPISFSCSGSNSKKSCLERPLPGAWYETMNKRNTLAKTPYMFVTVGSTDFDALIQAADKLAPSLQAKGIMQIGSGQYIPTNWPYFRFASSLDPYYEQATVVVAHGGLATTMEVLQRGLPLVSVSNPDRYDHHQDDLLTAMTQEGYLVWCRQLDELGQAVKTALAAAEKGTFKRYEPSECEIHRVIHNYLLTGAKNVPGKR
jgi:UDP-N-acetylglucosamine transferase subunit ALG13